jgi:hypothetical protein
VDLRVPARGQILKLKLKICFKFPV